MKYFLLVALCAVAVTASKTPTKNRVNGVNGWYVPQVDGTLIWVNMNVISQQISRSKQYPNIVKFYLYTTANGEPAEIEASTDSISHSEFNTTNPTRIFIPGWQGHRETSIYTVVRDAWFSKRAFNYIFVEWDRALSEDYISGFSAVPGVGKKVAALVDFLVNNYELKLETLKMIGFGMGAHISGYAGKNIVYGKLGTIVGLDPAFALFDYNKPYNRLNSTDATYVVSVQTDVGVYGSSAPIGNIAFYPNGGQYQPGCENDACSHVRALKYYAEAVVKGNYLVIKCADYSNAVAKNCGDIYSCYSAGTVANVNIDTGVFFVPVYNISPNVISA